MEMSCLTKIGCYNRFNKSYYTEIGRKPYLNPVNIPYRRNTYDFRQSVNELFHPSVMTLPQSYFRGYMPLAERNAPLKPLVLGVYFP